MVSRGGARLRKPSGTKNGSTGNRTSGQGRAPRLLTEKDLRVLEHCAALGISTERFHLGPVEVDDTCEVRWFLGPEVGDDARRWFDALGPVDGFVEHESPRTDLYVLTGSDALGFKGRDAGEQGKLQPKYLRRDVGTEPLARAAGGAGRCLAVRTNGGRAEGPKPSPFRYDRWNRPGDWIRRAQAFDGMQRRSDPALRSRRRAAGSDRRLRGLRREPAPAVHVESHCGCGLRRTLPGASSKRLQGISGLDRHSRLTAIYLHGMVRALMESRFANAADFFRAAAIGPAMSQDIVVLDVIRLLGLIRPGRGPSF